MTRADADAAHDAHGEVRHAMCFVVGAAQLTAVFGVLLRAFPKAGRRHVTDR